MKVFRFVALSIGLAAPALAQAADPLEFGLQVMFVGMFAVFAGLTAVYVFLMILRRYAENKPKRHAAAAGALEPPAQVSTEVAHAIALALYMDLRTFDEEVAEEITIRKITRPFSPWWNAGKAQIMHDKADAYRR